MVAAGLVLTSVTPASAWITVYNGFSSGNPGPSDSLFPQVAISDSGTVGITAFLSSANMVQVNTAAIPVATSGPGAYAGATWGATPTALDSIASAQMAPRLELSADGTAATVLWIDSAGALKSRSGSVAYTEGSNAAPTVTWAPVATLAAGADSTSAPRLAASADGTLLTAMWRDSAGALQSAAGSVTPNAGAAPTVLWSAVVASGDTGVALNSLDATSRIGSAGVSAVWATSTGKVLLRTATVTSTPTIVWTSAVEEIAASLGERPRVAASSDGSVATVVWINRDGTSLTGYAKTSALSGSVRTTSTAVQIDTWADGAGEDTIEVATSADGLRATTIWKKSGTSTTTYARHGQFTVGAGTVSADWGSSTFGVGNSYLDTAGMLQLDLSADGERAIAVWTGNGVIYRATARVVGVRGFWMSAVQSISASATSDNYYPHVAMTPSGSQYLAAWHRTGTAQLGSKSEALLWDTTAPVVTGDSAPGLAQGSTFIATYVLQGNEPAALWTVSPSDKFGVTRETSSPYKGLLSFKAASTPGVHTATLVGWDESGNVSAEFTVTVTAGYTVTYYGNSNSSGAVPSVGAYDGTNPYTVADNTGNLVRNGYTFGGWSTTTSSTGGTAYAVGSTYAQTANLSLYAKWIPNTYTITYDSNTATSGAAPGPGSYTVGGMGHTVLGNTGSMALDGKYFAGWSTTPGGGVTNTVGGTLVPTADTTLYAVWLTPVTYTITFDANGATAGSAPAAGSYTTGGPAHVLPGNTGLMTKTDKVFSGWALGAGNTTGYAVGASITPGANLTLYALWLSPQTYTVTYSANGGTGTVPSVDTYTTGGSAITLPDGTGLAKTGYVFGGWSTVANGTALTGTYSPSATGTLHAVWKQAFTITYQAIGVSVGSVPAAGTYVSGGNAYVIAGNTGSLERSGYTFDGWRSTSNVAYAPGASYSTNAPLTLNAVWTAVTATPSADSSLRSLAVVNGAATTALDSSASGRTGQSVTVANATTSVTVTAELGSNLATWQYRIAGGNWVTMSGTTTSIPVAVGADSTVVDVKVLAQDGQTTSTWTFTVNREAATGGGTTGGGTGGGGSSTPSPAPADVTAPTIIAPAKADVIVGKDRSVAKLEANEGATWEIHGGNDKARFTIDGNGNLAFTGDAETGSYTVEVAATDGSGNKTVKTITINVVNPAKSIVFEPHGQTNGDSSPAAPQNFSVKGLPETGTLVAPAVLPTAVKDVTINGGEVRVTPNPAFSGKFVLDLEVKLGNSISTVQLPVTIDPAVVPAAASVPTASKRTTVTWTSVANAVAYDVVLDGKVICSGAVTTCAVPALLGPNAKLEVVSLGNDGTKSAAIVPAYSAGKPVTAAKVTFASNSASLTKAAKTELTKLVKLVKRQGFTRIVVEGHTDGQGGSTNAAALSAKRAVAVADFLKRSLKVSITTKAAGNTKPVASNATAVGQAANRRVEALVA